MQDAASIVYLVGATPDGLQQDKLGAYELDTSAEVVNGRHVYSLRDGKGTKLWWAGGEWWVGPEAEIGKAQGFIHAASHEYLPERVGTTWKVTRGWKGWADAAELHILTNQSHARDFVKMLSSPHPGAKECAQNVLDTMDPAAIADTLTEALSRY